ncbi:hypothetical protein C9374_013153 [Naegleria lovaniensis]|uniref:EGF-like domain-containing protein n=1 Tax=Naegleria lovaniensis TaxID=51637 RepID=A0AA88GBL7_NAELO|nr:uncharacterized protein C9374_013153 [Naegleria lovaniensis]KAG2372789.1 hypothetical protein C9374_013153 [Naegleria lovaniensis]
MCPRLRLVQYLCFLNLLVVCVFLAPVVTCAYSITTIVGTGAQGSGGDSGNALSAQLYWPKGVYEYNNEIYIADTYNHKIRKVSQTGIITTIAGTGNQGYSGDLGLAINAQLSLPTYVYVDSTGVYVADAGNNCIRRIQNDRIETVFSTGLQNPLFVSFNSNRDMYIVDADNNVLKKVSNGVVSNVVGSGTRGFGGDGSSATSALLDRPAGAYMSSSSNEIYISDTYNNRIRKVSSSGFISTLAGSTQGFSGDGNLARDARLDHPSRLLVNSKGVLFFADTNNHVIRKISGDIITTIAGIGGSNGFNDGSFYIADSLNNRIRMLRPLCNGVVSNDPSVCSGRGQCLDEDTCTCTQPSLYGGPYCELPKCNNKLSNETGVCNARGTCSSPNTCTCTEPAKFGGNDCEFPKCFGILQTMASTVCSGHGSCDSPDVCRCNAKWTGPACDMPICFGMNQNETSRVCSGRGTCNGPDLCVCNSGFTGQSCEKSIPVLLVNKMFISQGQTITITTNELQASDPVANDSQLQFIVSNMLYGRFELSSVSVNVFSQQQVKDGQVKFVHTGTNNQPPTFQITVSNGVVQTSQQSPSITFNVGPYVNDKMLDQTVQVDQEFKIPVSKNMFIDPDGETLTSYASLETGQPLPSWIKFDEKTYFLSGKSSEPSTNKFKFYVVDRGNLKAECVFSFKVVANSGSSGNSGNSGNSGLGVADIVGIAVGISTPILTIIGLLVGGGGIWQCVKHFKKPKSTLSPATTEISLEDTSATVAPKPEV